MKNYMLCALVATLGFIGPIGVSHAQEVPAPPVAAFDAGTPVVVDSDALLAPSELVTDTPDSAEVDSVIDDGASTPAEDAASDPIGTAGQIKEEIEGGNWGVAILLSLMLIVAVLRWGAGKFGFLSFFEGKLGGYILVFAASGGGMLLTLGAVFTVSSISQAVIFGFGAIGGWEAWKDIKSSKTA